MQSRIAAIFVAIAVAALATAGCAGKSERENVQVNVGKEETAPAREEVATFGAGCFWCVEAVFERIEGVLSVESGYSGGTVEDPTYHEVCAEGTGHAEVCRIRYDPSRVSFAELLEVFWQTHDPTTKDRQGSDVGSQYRSVIFTHDEEQRELAEEIKGKLNASGAFAAPIVTEIVPFTRFWPAEDYHQDYFARNPDAGYCQFVIVPKIQKLRKVFRDRLKK